MSRSQAVEVKQNVSDSELFVGGGDIMYSRFVFAPIERQPP